MKQAATTHCLVRPTRLGLSSTPRVVFPEILTRSLAKSTGVTSCYSSSKLTMKLKKTQSTRSKGNSPTADSRLSKLRSLPRPASPRYSRLRQRIPKRWRKTLKKCLSMRSMEFKSVLQLKPLGKFGSASTLSHKNGKVTSTCQKS